VKLKKMLKEKEKEKLFLWIFKFAGRKKVGMFFLYLISAAVFIWVFYVGKGSSFLLLLSYYDNYNLINDILKYTGISCLSS